ncbi:MAG: redoxin domain-containing protein [Armatimonadetes bacterium]|nr:redoxin domain-containing protein [Armatimonadota bacterium]
MNETNFTRRGFLLGGITLGVGIGTLSQGWARFSDIGPVTEGSKAPELIGSPQEWINTGGQALKALGPGGLLKANGPILIDFWDYTCVNCIRTMPYLRAWHERYGDKGLTIIGIHTPEFEFAKEKKNVEAAVKRLRLPYPVLVDSRYANWRAYGNQYWPRKYLINPQGIVVYDKIGEGGYEETERRIRQLLREAHPNVKLPAETGLPEAPRNVIFRQTPEIYSGYLRGRNMFGSPEGMKPNATVTYTDIKGRRADGLFYAKGLWAVQPESIRHARATSDPFEDYIALDYTALEVNAVIQPEGGKPFNVYLLHDGKPVDRADKGDDIRYDAQGRSFVRVDAPRMYSLIRNRKPGRHGLRLGSTSPDFGLYSFTFSSSPSLK